MPTLGDDNVFILGGIDQTNSEYIATVAPITSLFTDPNNVGIPTASFMIASYTTPDGTVQSWDFIGSGIDSFDSQVPNGLNTKNLYVLAKGMVFNGTAYDRVYSITDSIDNEAPLTKGLQGVMARLQGYNGSTGNFDRIKQRGNNLDNKTPENFGVIESNGYQHVFNGNSWERKRTANIWHSVTASVSGNTAVWTPTAGKRFRLMRVRISVVQDSTFAGGGTLTAALYDGATPIGLQDVSYIPASGVAVHPVFEFDLDNGYLSQAVNQVLYINLSLTLASGAVVVSVGGCEE